MRNVILLILALSMSWGCLASSASAIPQFQKVFLDIYIKEHSDPEFSEFVIKDVKCWACHQGKSRKNHNAYGVHLVDLLDKTEDRKDVEKITAALEKVSEMHVDPDDEESETYGERIAAGKLPGADTLDELKAEPESKEALSAVR